MTFKTENWNKPTPARWRNTGDAIMVLGAGLTAMFAALPLTDETKLWILPIVGIATPIGKFLTKLFAE